MRAYGGPRYQLTQQVMSRFAEAIEQARVDVVPKILIGSSAASGSDGVGRSGSLLEALLALLLSDKLAAETGEAGPPSPAAAAYRREIEAAMRPRDAA